MASTSTQQSEVVTLEQLANHNTEESLWIAVHGHVYNLTDFRLDHPGGVDALLSSAGTDGTEAYEYAAHSKENLATMQQFRIGTLAGSLHQATPSSHGPSLVQVKRTERVNPSLKQSVLSQTKLATTVIATSAAVAVYYLPSILNVYKIQLPSFAGHDTGYAFWAGMGVASSVSFVVFRYMYLLFLSSLEFQGDVFSFPPTIPRKSSKYSHRNH
ncbi:cytochrome b5-like heme/steroid binding domain-containing protein [Xylaria flabelliformis]|nr:cytochrome b5-like heme/steroid binding domain-containing protein [Xylaria flabelliformis]